MKKNLIIRSRSPLRISFAGGGTDVPPYPELYGGAVISTTIDRYAYVTLKSNSNKGIRVISQDFGLLEKFQNISELKISGKTSLIKAALLYSNIKNPNFDLTIHVDSPPGSGLGSSSALAVSLIGCLHEFQNKEFDAYEISNLAINLERNILGIKGGYQDQFASTFGGFNFIEFSKSVTVNPLKIKNEILYELLASLILIDTGKTRLSGNILDKQIKLYEKKDTKTLENLNEIKKLAYDFKNSLLKGNIPDLGNMIDFYWMRKKSIMRSITTKHIDNIYDLAKKSGVYGGKLLGAGGGGHMMFLCDPNNKQKIIEKLENHKLKVVTFNFDHDGLKIWKVLNNKVIY